MTAAHRPKHVVILVENLPVPFDRRPWQIAQTLRAHGHKISIICPKMYEYTLSRECLDGIDIYRYPHREGNSQAAYVLEYLNALFWMFLLCVRIFFTRGIDAIHACNPPDLLFLVALPFKLFFGTKFLFDHHDLNPEVFRAKFNRQGRIYDILCWLEKKTYQAADMVLATNESFKRIGIARSRKPLNRVYIVRNAPRAGRLVQGPPIPELLQGKKHLIAYLGVMNKQDGLDLLIQSAREVIHTHGRKDVIFGLIGDGGEVPVLKQLAKEAQLNGELQFLGRISDGRVISNYLNTATVCVCPDPKNDMNDFSTMTKVVEYMALGKPIVAYDLHETLYSAGDAAAYATNNDPAEFAKLIVQLLDDQPRRDTMGRRGKQRYDSQLAWERQQEQLLAAYDQMLAMH